MHLLNSKVHCPRIPVICACPAAIPAFFGGAGYCNKQASHTLSPPSFAPCDCITFQNAVAGRKKTLFYYQYIWCLTGHKRFESMLFPNNLNEITLNQYGIEIELTFVPSGMALKLGAYENVHRGSRPGSVVTGRDREVRGATHNWPSVVRVREGLVGRDLLVSSRTSDSCGGPGAVCASQGCQVHGVASDTLVRLASGLDARCVKKQYGWLDCVSEDA